MRCKQYPLKGTIVNARGSVLITIIIAMVAVSTLGAGIAYIGRTTPFLQTSQHLESMAFNLAESGFRHVYPYLYSSSLVDRPAIVANINNTSYTFTNGGKFTITASWDAGTKSATVVSTGLVNENSNTVEGRHAETYVVKWPGEYETDSANLDDWNEVLDSVKKMEINSGGPQSGDNAVVVQVQDEGAEALLTLDKNIIASLPAGNGLLSYEMQVKIEVDKNGGKGKEYMVGLSFRITQLDSDTWNEYGVSFLRNEDAGSDHALPPVFQAVFLSKPVGIYVVLWKKLNDLYTILDYHQATASDGIITGTGTNTELASSGLMWCILSAKVQERFTNAGTKENVISIYVKGPTSRGTVSWDYSTFMPVQWTIGPTSLPSWTSNTSYLFDAMVRPATSNGHYYVSVGAGTSGASAPTWPTGNGAAVSDGTVTWVETKSIVDSSLTSSDAEFDPNNPFEAGLHVFYDSKANNDVMFDDFALRTLGAGTVVQQ
jgi:hypothetical protein